MNRLSFRVLAFISSLACAGILAGCPKAPAPPNPAPSNPPIASRPFPGTGPSQSISPSNDPNLALGNPSGAATDANNFLLSKPQYTLSFNRRNGTPNWVSWRTSAASLGSEGRSNRFHPDDALPADSQIYPSDYKGSGYDRGHMCPSGDRTNSPEDNDATFAMSNMVPQTPELNRFVWESFENYARDLVRSGNEVYQVAGPVGNAGTIADGRVVIPVGCWKMIVVLPANGAATRHIDAQTRVIAIAIPNTFDEQLKTADWRSYRTTPRAIERATHLDLFSNLPPQLKTILEQKTDAGD